MAEFYTWNVYETSSKDTCESTHKQHAIGLSVFFRIFCRQVTTLPFRWNTSYSINAQQSNTSPTIAIYDFRITAVVTNTKNISHQSSHESYHGLAWVMVSRVLNCLESWWIYIHNRFVQKISRSEDGLWQKHIMKLYRC